MNISIPSLGCNIQRDLYNLIGSPYIPVVYILPLEMNISIALDKENGVDVEDLACRSVFAVALGLCVAPASYGL